MHFPHHKCSSMLVMFHCQFVQFAVEGGAGVLHSGRGSTMSTPVSDRNGRTTAVVPELEMIKELKAMNDQIRERCQRLEEAEKHSLMFMIDRNRKLEAQIIAYQQEIRVQDRNLNKAIRERDNVRILLEEVRLLRERDDEEIRKKLKVELLRASELESENHRLRFARC